MSDVGNRPHVDWRFADLRMTFPKRRLVGAKMQGVEAQQVDFRNADLRQANLGGAYLEGAMLPRPAAQRTAPTSEIARNRRPREQTQTDGRDHGQPHERDHSQRQ